MKHDELVAAVDRIRHSSAFAPGDPTTFKIPVLRHELELPGPCDPYDYIALLKAKLGLADFAEEHRVAVIGAGLGGLPAAALDLGVAEVVSIEPRARFRAGLDLVTGVLNEVHPVRKNESEEIPDQHRTRCFGGWPTEGHLESLGVFDLVIWPECFEEAVFPVEALVVALKLLKPGGQLAIEVKLGQNEHIPAGRINSWLPTAEAFEKLVLRVNGKAVSASMPGRAGNKLLYIIEAFEPKIPAIQAAPSTLPAFPRDPKAPVVVAEAAPATGLPVFPRDPAPRTVHRIGAPPAPPAPPQPPPVAAEDSDNDVVVILDEPLEPEPEPPIEPKKPGRRGSK